MEQNMPTTYVPGKAGAFAKTFYSMVDVLGEHDAVEKDFETFQDAINSRYDVKTKFRSNEVSKKQIDVLVKGLKLSEATGSFLDYVREKQLLSKLDDIIAGYRQIRKEKSGIVPTKVMTATDMSANEKKDFEEFVTARHLKKGQKLDIQYEIDPSIGVGLKYEVGNVSVNDTLESKLDQLYEVYTAQRSSLFDREIADISAENFSLPPTDFEKKLFAIFDKKQNYGYDWSKIPTTLDADGRFDIPETVKRVQLTKPSTD
eukprot:CAMPEP_0201551830 /NCGR_PEP_ID=MMETSP0173_2-20130828/10721_1 /ASSEMBLY_ACC=CAM_ASM_000268 /TAXON_ID=218659 /ORGANISM="Vexillifera sp., Strain DIVA3 564/2" /LENGTH=258 /DNA_ID=CAMNT_0047962179 /DNA_START=129 /DNA_END=905 /DNA_ORIENTATION=+